jgi:hypothetical protein
MVTTVPRHPSQDELVQGQLFQRDAYWVVTVRETYTDGTLFSLGELRIRWVPILSKRDEPWVAVATGRDVQFSWHVVGFAAAIKMRILQPKSECCGAIGSGNRKPQRLLG